MIFFAQKQLEGKKKLILAFSECFGIGVPYSISLCKRAGLHPNGLARDLNVRSIRPLLKAVSEERKTGTLLERFMKNNIKKEVVIRSYKGIRHLEGLPVRGQNTKSNGKTNKKKPKVSY